MPEAKWQFFSSNALSTIDELQHYDYGNEIMDKHQKAMSESSERLFVALEQVRDEATFIEFLRALGEDWSDDVRKSKKVKVSPYGPSINGWENGDIGSFLDAAVSCARSNLHESQGKKHNIAGVWQRAAHILLYGKYYE